MPTTISPDAVIDAIRAQYDALLNDLWFAFEWKNDDNRRIVECGMRSLEAVLRELLQCDCDDMIQTWRADSHAKYHA